MSIPASQDALTWLQAHGSPPNDTHEILALGVHALLLYHGFRPAETAPDAQPTALPSDWGGAGYGGRYRHARSAMEFDIRAVRMGGRLLIHATPIEDDAHVHTVDVRVDEYVTTGDSWPTVIPRLDDLATIVAVQIAHRLVPDATKAGYEDAAGGEQGNSTATGSGSGHIGGRSGPTPRPMPGPRPMPPGIEPLRDDRHYDPLRIGPPRRAPGLGQPSVPFGADDLLPPGLQARSGGMFGGNLMGPGHFGRGGRRPGGRLPPGVPPGARFDPYYPIPDNDAEMPPGFEDEHGVGSGGGNRREDGNGNGDDGPPAGMYW